MCFYKNVSHLNSYCDHSLSNFDYHFVAAAADDDDDTADVDTGISVDVDYSVVARQEPLCSIMTMMM